MSNVQVESSNGEYRRMLQIMIVSVVAVVTVMKVERQR